MSTDAQRALFWLLISMMIIGTFIVTGRTGTGGDGPELQTSEYQWIGCIDEEYIVTICRSNQIDPNGCWRIECPKCKSWPGVTWETRNDGDGEGAYYERRLDGSTLCNFLYTYREIEKIEPGETVVLKDPPNCVYCKNCGYPLGTDWKMVVLDPNGQIGD